MKTDGKTVRSGVGVGVGVDGRSVLIAQVISDLRRFDERELSDLVVRVTAMPGSRVYAPSAAERAVAAT